MTQPPAVRVSAWWLLPPGLLFGGQLAYVLANGAPARDEGVYDAGYLAAAATTALLIGGYALVAAVFSRAPYRQVLAPRRVPIRRAAALWLGGVAALVVINLLLDPLLGAEDAQGVVPDAAPGDSRQWLLLALAIPLLGVAVPIAEELMFRGLTYSALPRFPVLGSATLFAVAHALPELLPVVLLAGLVLGEVRRRSDSTLPAMAVHATLNTSAILLPVLF